jgi:hypothetical protein
MLRTWCLTTALAASLVPAGLAQSRAQGFGRSADQWCDDGGNDRRARHCEVREETVVRPASLDVDARRNGGIRVRGWDGADVLVRTKIVARADGTTRGARIRGARPDGGGRARAHRRRIPTATKLERAPDSGAPDDHSRSTPATAVCPSGTPRDRAVPSQNGGVTLSNVGGGDIRGGTRTAASPHRSHRRSPRAPGSTWKRRTAACASGSRGIFGAALGPARRTDANKYRFSDHGAGVIGAGHHTLAAAVPGSAR